MEKGLSKHVHREAAKLRSDKSLVPLTEITTQLKERSTTKAVTLPPSENGAELTGIELVRKPSVSTVVVMTVDKDDQDAYGTGFVIAPGVVVTNWHVACPDKEFSDILVMDHDGKVHPVIEGLAGAADADLAVIRFKDPDGKVPSLPLADVLPPPGESVWQVGHTHESWWTATHGMINRYCMEPFTPKTSKQEIQLPVMDVSNKISAGSSGSAVVDSLGRVVGVYHHRRWYYQTAGSWKISEGGADSDDKAAKPVEIKDRVVLFTRNFCIPVTRLRAMFVK
jgi:S1-C subfamily serine protease